MHRKKGSLISVAVASKECAVRLWEGVSYSVPWPIFHLETAVLVGLDKLETAAGDTDNYLIFFIGNASMFDHLCLLFFFPSIYLCFLVVANTVHDQ